MVQNKCRAVKSSGGLDVNKPHDSVVKRHSLGIRTNRSKELHRSQYITLAVNRVMAESSYVPSEIFR